MSDEETKFPPAIAAMIMDELMTHERYAIWLAANYQVHVMMNEEDKRIEVKVIEEDLAHAEQNLARSVKEIVEARKQQAPQIELAGADVLDKLPRA